MISCKNRIQLLFYCTFFKQYAKEDIQPFCFWGEHSEGLGNQADVELNMINAISTADIAFIMSSSQAIVNWLNALDQSDFSWWVWCIIILFIIWVPFFLGLFLECCISPMKEYSHGSRQKITLSSTPPVASFSCTMNHYTMVQRVGTKEQWLSLQKSWHWLHWL